MLIKWIQASTQQNRPRVFSNAYNSGTWTLASQTYGNGQTWSYTYNNSDQITKRTSGDIEFRYFYNNEGALARVEQYKAGTLTSVERWYYDTNERLTRVVNLDGSGNVTYSYNWTYDHNDNVTALTETVNGQSSNFTYGYNSDQQMTSVGGKVSRNYTYDSYGRLSGRTGGPVTVGYTYRNIDSTYTTTQVATLTNTYDGAAHNLNYTYDANGNILSVSDGANTTSYVYDSFGQLTRENNQAAGKTWTWTYDTGGNILSRSEYAYTTGELGDTTDTVSYTYGDAGWGDLLTAYDGSAITYDGVGNMTVYDGWTFTWQGGRQLAGMTNGTTALSFEYNESGLRTKKSDGTTTHSYIYRGEQLIADVTATDALYFRYDQNGDVLGFSYNNAEYTYVKNVQGDILAILDSTGAEVASYTYDAWGNVLTSLGSLAELNPLRYRGYVYDTETSLYYLQSRYYDAEIGRFINVDSQISGVSGNVWGYNFYTYGSNNPVNTEDSSGNWPKWVEGAWNVVTGTLQVAAGAVLGAAAGWTGVGAVAAAVLIADGVATATQGIGQIYNDVTNTNTFYEGNLLRTGAQAVGQAIGGDTGAAIGGAVYDTAVTAASLYGSAFMTANPGNSACFVEGTVVLTSTGFVAIEQICSGDLVWAWNEETGEKELKEVVQTFVNETRELVHIYVNDEEVITTPEHPFYVLAKGWTAAKKLRIGDSLILQSGELVAVDFIVREFLDAPITVYNFEVAGFHTYYVGEYAVLVHNACQQPDNLSPAGAGRHGAFKQAKRDAGIPVSQQPTDILPNYNKRGKLVPGRVYVFGLIEIREDSAGHTYKDGGYVPPHFNTPDGGHYYY